MLTARCLPLVVAALCVTASVPSAAHAWCDPAGTFASVDGAITPGEYPGSSVGTGTGFGSYLGGGARLYVDSSSTGGLAFALDSTGGTCAPGVSDTIVIYLDAVPAAGISDTTGLTDNADGGRAAASAMGTDGARADLTFPTGFAPESALVIGTSSVSLYRLVAGGSHTFVRALTLAPAGAAFATACVREVGGIDLADLGSQVGNPLRWIATLMNSSNAFRSNEFHGVPVVPGANIGVASFTITSGLGVPFSSFGPPVGLVGPFAYLDFEEFTGTGFTPTPTCGQLSSGSFAATGWSDGVLLFGGTNTTGDYARGTSAVAVSTGGFHAFTSVPGGAGRTLGFQPGGTDFAPGTLTLRLRNDGSTTITGADVAYQIYVRNDQGRSNSVDFSYSMDGTAFTAVAALQVLSIAAADVLGFVANPRSTTLSSLLIPPGGYLFVRFSSADVAGSGSRDEFALDDIVVRPTFSACGNASVDAGETCDSGASNGSTTCGCLWTCTFTPSGTACGGGGGGACDAADTCSGAGACVDRFLSAGAVCAAADPAMACDTDDVCTGTSAACPARFVLAGTVCSAADPTMACDTDDICSGTSGACAPAFVAGGTSCRASTGTCDLGASCTGASVSCPSSAPAGAGIECRAGAGVCDAAESCTGSSLACPADGFAAASTECRATVGSCDVAESCTGSAAACPADAGAPAGSACGGPPSGACDEQDVCSGGVGVSATCDVRLAPAGTSCRASIGSCDVAESCTGSAVACPADAGAPAGTACGAPPSGICDAPDVCSGGLGASATCDARFAAASTVCRAPVGECDVGETCSGAAIACPGDAAAAPGTACGSAPSGACDEQDECRGAVGATATCEALLAAASTPCRAAVGECDVAEACTGAAVACPADAAAAAGRACGPVPTGLCDDQDACSGSIGASAVCSARFVAASTTCRPVADLCDAAEVCSGSAAACPVDGALPVGTVCRATTGVCDVAETCDGSAVGCSTDAFVAAGTECRVQASTCDVTETCGGGAMCPADAFDPTCDCTTDAECADSSACTTDTCVIPSGSATGMCATTAIPLCCEIDTDCTDDDGDLCTLPSCDTTAMACSEVAMVCDDSDDCTTDACTPADGTCAFSAIPGCLMTDAGPMPDGGTMPDVGTLVDGGASTDGGRRDAGTAGDGSMGADAGAAAPSETGGCACRATGSDSRSAPVGLLAGFAVAFAVRISRRRARA